MRPFAAAFFVLVLMSGGMSATAHAASCYQEMQTSTDKTGDWFATFGKNEKEKKQILAKRKHDRFMACVQKNFENRRRPIGI